MASSRTAGRLTLAGVTDAGATVLLVLASATVAHAQRPVTFNRDVAPIIFENCASCHRPGESAPFSLLNYADVKTRAQLIVDATRSHYMPPWQPDSAAGEFQGDRRLDDRDIQTLQRWTEGGAIEGEAGDLPPAPNFSRQWRLGIPDIVVSFEEPYTVPAEGRDVFRNFVLPIPLTERRYVKAIEFRPGNPRVVHHARILLDDTGEVRRLDAADPAPGFGGMDVPGARFPDGHFLGWAPGKMPDTEAYPWSIEPGTDFIVQLHLKPTGREESLPVSIAVYFTDKPPTATPIMVRLGVKTIDIPAGESAYAITDSYELPVDVSVYSIYPHAHYLATRMEITAERPDGTTESLLSIPHWDFNWQDEYHYRRPLVLRKGTTIRMRYTYDNSADNPRNPNQPPERVRFGSDTTDEMGELLLQVLPKNPSDVPKLRSDVMRKNLLTDIEGEEKLLKETPTDVDMRNTLGVTYAKLGRGEEAKKEFEKVVRQAPDHAMGNYNLAVIAMAENRLDAAYRLLMRAIATRPDYAEAHNNLGVLLESTGRSDEALAQYHLALASRPTSPAALNNLGRALLGRGDVEAAVVQLQAALRTRPDHPDALYNLGRAALAQGHPKETVQHWRRVLVSRPDSLSVLIDLAWLLAVNPDVQNAGEAVKLAERANGLTGNSNAAALDVLSVAYAAEGQFDLAARTGQRAFQRALAASDERRAAEIRQRLQAWDQAKGDATSPGIP